MDFNYIEILPEQLIITICEYLQSDIKLLKNSYSDNKYITKIITELLDNIKNGNINPDIWFNKIVINYNKLVNKISRADELKIIGDFIEKYWRDVNRQEFNYNILKNLKQITYFNDTKSSEDFLISKSFDCYIYLKLTQRNNTSVCRCYCMKIVNGITKNCYLNKDIISDLTTNKIS